MLSLNGNNFEDKMKMHCHILVIPTFGVNWGKKVIVDDIFNQVSHSQTKYKYDLSHFCNNFIFLIQSTIKRKVNSR
jgi:hypothetical protein